MIVVNIAWDLCLQLIVNIAIAHIILPDQLTALPEVVQLTWGVSILELVQWHSHWQLNWAHANQTN